LLTRTSCFRPTAAPSRGGSAKLWAGDDRSESGIPIRRISEAGLRAPLRPVPFYWRSFLTARKYYAPRPRNAPQREP
jgi:hypothetical protein